jgi:hypothetical protein
MTKTYVRIVVIEVLMTHPMENKNLCKCYWCNNKATKIDYRTIDRITSKLVSCNDCFEISTKKLLNKIRKDLDK